MLLRIVIAPLGLTIELSAPRPTWHGEAPPPSRGAPERPTLPPNVFALASRAA